MRKYSFTKLISFALVICMALSALAGCTGEKPGESTPVVTPEETPANTPAETPEQTPANTPADTPNETPEDTPKETPQETPPASEPLVDYNISYDLDGGIDGGNPATYNKDSEFTLAIPVKVGYDFAGWTGTGLDAATKLVTVKKGTEGDLSFKATWVENTVDFGNADLDETHFGKDDGIAEKEGEHTISVNDTLGTRGEGIYYLKTVYTTIAMDGVKDAAYSYGLHFEGDVINNTTFYDTREPAGFDVYMIRTQDGYINVYIEVVDPEIVVNSYIFKTLNLSYHCDSIDFYYERGNLGVGTNVYNFIADPTGTFKKTMPAGTKIVATEKGYAIETRIDNNGVPFNENDELGFSFFLNETRDWNETEKTYEKNLIKNHSVLNPVGTKYKSPSAAIQDAVRITLASATGKVDVNSNKPAKTGDMLTDITNGVASVLITYDQYATAQTIIVAQNLRNLLLSRGCSVSITSEELIADGFTCDYEIVVGKTTREESMELVNSLAYNEYGVAIGEDTIAVVGWNEGAAYGAYDLVCELIDHVILGGKTADFGSRYTLTLDALEYDSALKMDGLDSITDVGEDAYQIYKLKSTLDEYNAYCAQLTAGGFTLYTSNLIAEKVYCATYTKGNIVVNVQFANGGERTMQNLNPDNSLRVVVEPLSNTALPSLEKPEDADAKVVQSSISQIYPHHFCMVVQLSNGHFIIIDSGNNGRQRDLSDFLRSKAPDQNNVIIDAWIFTHFHQDHIGGFIDHMGVSSLTRYITVKNVIYNFPQKQVTDYASSNDQNNLRLWYEKRMPDMRAKGTTFYQARTGQKYYFGNAEIEILWTYEELMPFNTFVDNSNHTCIGFSITIEGQKIMVTGDTTEAEFRVAASKYGDYLKSDFVQLAHHGGGNGGGDHNFYKLVNAPVVFHPNESEKYPGVGGNEKWAINNGQLVIRCGNYGTATLYLPFTIGDTIESSKTPTAETPNSVVG